MKTLVPGATWLLSLHTLLLALALLMVPALAGAQQHEGSQGAIIRIGGDASLPSGERSDAVINGNATIAGGEVDELTVINGNVDVDEGSIVNGDVTLIDAELRQAPGATIRGNVNRETGFRLGEGFRIFGLIFGIGYAIAVIIGGVLVAVIVSRQARAIGETIAGEPGPSLLAALLGWILLPMLAIACMVTIIGIPLGIAILLFLLPVLGFLGYLATGIRFGDYLVEKIRGERETDRPYRAVLFGVGILVLVGWIPVLGSIVSFVAAFIGSGAIVLAAWRTLRQRKESPIPARKGEEEQPYQVEGIA